MRSTFDTYMPFASFTKVSRIMPFNEELRLRNLGSFSIWASTTVRISLDTISRVILTVSAPGKSAIDSAISVSGVLAIKIFMFWKVCASLVRVEIIREHDGLSFGASKSTNISEKDGNTLSKTTSSSLKLSLFKDETLWSVSL